jgi:hypothetical protein
MCFKEPSLPGEPVPLIAGGEVERRSVINDLGCVFLEEMLNHIER